MTPNQTWHTYPPLQLNSPVLALTAGNGKLWAGSVGGLACYDQGWKLQNYSLPLTSVTALCYADQWLVAGGAEGIARSPDGGANWQLSTISGTIYPIAVILASPNFTNDHTFLAGTIGGGVIRSENAGRTWKPANFGLQNFDVIDLAWNSANILLAATADGIYRSPNGGRAWRAVNGTEGLSISTIVSLPDGSALAGIENGGLLHSTNDGASWLDLPTNLPEEAQPALLVVSIQNNLVLSTLQHGSFISEDGRVWRPIDPQGFLSFCLSETQLYAGMSDGFILLENNSFKRLPAPPLHDLRYILTAQGRLYIAGLHSGLWIWDNAKGWLALPDTPEMITALAATPDGALALSAPEGMLRSIDGGWTWNTVFAGEDGLAAHITFREDGCGWAAKADGTRLLISDDRGLSWKPMNTPFGVLPLVALQATSKMVIAATYNYARQNAQLWYSLDDGLTWKRGAEVRTNWPVVATCANPPLITLGGMMFLLQSDDSGQQHTVGPSGSGVRRVVSDGQILLAFTTAGLLRSENLGRSWQPEHDSPPLDEILDITQDGGALYVLLTEGRVWSRTMV